MKSSQSQHTTLRLNSWILFLLFNNCQLFCTCMCYSDWLGVKTVFVKNWVVAHIQEVFRMCAEWGKELKLYWQRIQMMHVAVSMSVMSLSCVDCLIYCEWSLSILALANWKGSTVVNRLHGHFIANFLWIFWNVKVWRVLDVLYAENVEEFACMCTIRSSAPYCMSSLGRPFVLITCNA